MFPFAIFIGGPTASYKTELALNFKAYFPSFIINSDSMQVYDKLEILTNRPVKQLRKNMIVTYLVMLYTQINVMLEVGKKALFIKNKKIRFQFLLAEQVYI